jgi:hypothetical protein
VDCVEGANPLLSERRHVINPAMLHTMLVESCERHLVIIQQSLLVAYNAVGPTVIAGYHPVVLYDTVLSTTKQ